MKFNVGDDVQINWGKGGGFMKKNKLNGKIAQQLQKNIDYEITAVKIQPEGLIAFRNNGDGTYSKEVLKI